jgi:nitroimidazol reductase NimA-like FMN-containing flavoprotein (pyridoxamine 5'-phosphate oxidase superfamily)
MADREPASARTISIDDGPPRPWAQARACLAQAPTYWLATVRPDGRPHLVPVLGVWVDGAPHFVANTSSRKAQNLAASAHCVISVSGDGLDVVIEGEATQIHDQPTLRRVAEAYASKYNWHVTVREGAFHDTQGAPTAGPPPYQVYRVAPTIGFGLGTSEPARSTRWRFQPSHIQRGQRPRPAEGAQ